MRNIIEEVFERYLSGESMLLISKDFNHRGVLMLSKHIGLKEKVEYGKDRLLDMF